MSPAWRRYGEHGALLELPSLDAVHRAHRRARSSGLVRESVPGARTLYVEAVAGTSLDEVLRVVAADDGDTTPPPAPRLHRVEVVYDGADLADVAERAGLEVAEVVRIHTAPTYTVAFLGFSRAFPYLAGLDRRLDIPRLAHPRTSVPAGSVGMGGGFTGIYPMASPGGWHLLGRTVPRFFDERREPPSLLAVGDQLQFVAVDALPGSIRALMTSAQTTRPQFVRAPTFAVVRLAAGLVTTQDEGRPGRGHEGVARSGAWDRRSHRLANRLVGNLAGAATLECTTGGLDLQASGAAVVAVTGATVAVEVDGREAATDVALRVGAGATVRIGPPQRGLRAYVAVRGGFDTEVVLGSRSYDTLGRIGPPPLRVGDLVAVGHEHDPAALPWEERVPVAPVPTEAAVVRVTLGPRHDRLGSAGVEQLLRTAWSVHGASDRTGIRLDGPPLSTSGPDLPSEAMIPGAVQLPSGGLPIVLGPDCGTTGGYPVVAVVVTEDLDVLAQLRPGDTLRLRVA